MSETMEIERIRDQIAELVFEVLEEGISIGTMTEREAWTRGIQRVKNHYQLRGGPVLLGEALKLLSIASRKGAWDDDV